MVVLGPFSSRGVLDSQEKFLRAISGGTAAREAGQHLAWDPKSGRGKGRFMLAPCFRTARDAWDFYRGTGPAGTVAEMATNWRLVEIGPVCTCGLEGDLTCRACGAEYERHCFRHQPEADIHRCRRAA
ncbi:hypothetical protein ACZ90_00480 [Streptomyces albus subsp. albus]|nr:hypothetical protein ACZ90_00480 [Streptomyces albus subsp. albus]